VLDLRSIREDPDAARAGLARRGAADELDELLRLDARRREILPALEEGRARRNRVSEEIAELKRAGEDAGEPIAEMRATSSPRPSPTSPIPRPRTARPTRIR
jgi:seryl-tRNA synthetase